jgi:hypothetical protein
MAFCLVARNRAGWMATYIWFTCPWVSMLTFFIEKLLSNVLMRFKTCQFPTNFTLITQFQDRKFFFTLRFVCNQPLSTSCFIRFCNCLRGKSFLKFFFAFLLHIGHDINRRIVKIRIFFLNFIVFESWLIGFLFLRALFGWALQKSRCKLCRFSKAWWELVFNYLMLKFLQDWVLSALKILNHQVLAFLRLLKTVDKLYKLLFFIL